MQKHFIGVDFADAQCAPLHIEPISFQHSHEIAGQARNDGNEQQTLFSTGIEIRNRRDAIYRVPTKNIKFLHNFGK